MRSLIVSMIVGGVTLPVVAFAPNGFAQDAAAGVTLSESEGAAASTPVVQLKSKAPAVVPPAAAGASPPSASGAGMTYGRYGGAVTEDSGEWGFRYHGYFRAPMNIGFNE